MKTHTESDTAPAVPGKDRMLISVIICTYNRAASLRVTLSDFVRMQAPLKHDFELLVIDNNSNDDTIDVIHEFERQLPSQIRYVCEKKQGLSHARNRGLREARGTWIVFTDDDVRIGANWLQALAECLPEYEAAIGGRVLPIWPKELPAWVVTEGPYLQHGVFLHYDLGELPRQICAEDEDAEPFGCNMAFHANLFRKYGGFRTDLGRKGNRLLAGEDSEMFSRLRAAGVPLYYIATALVHHPVEQHRLSFRYLIRWKFWAGYGDGRGANPQHTKVWLGVPAYRYRLLIVAAGRCFCGLLRRNSIAAAYHVGAMCVQVGYLVGAWFGYRNEVTELSLPAIQSVSPE